MTQCSVKNCSKKSCSGLGAFTVPVAGELREKWLQFIKSSGKEIHPNVTYRICEAHFRPKDIRSNKSRRTLKAGSIPIILASEVS